MFPALNKQSLTGGLDGSMWAVVIAVSVVFAVKFHSAILGGMMFAPAWYGASLLSRGDPQALPIYIAATRLRAIYDGSMRGDR